MLKLLMDKTTLCTFVKLFNPVQNLRVHVGNCDHPFLPQMALVTGEIEKPFEHVKVTELP